MILLLDTSTSVCQLTLIDGLNIMVFDWVAERMLAKGLLSFIKEKLDENHKEWSDLAGLGVFEGPGSFTGLRIGITVMNTLADGLGIPIVGGRGEGWRDEVQRRLENGISQKMILPFYGREANITLPKK